MKFYGKIIFFDILIFIYGFIYQKYYNKLATDLSYKTSEFLL